MPTEDIVSSSFILVIFFAALYIALIRPQLKRQQEHQKMLMQLRRGDEIVTSCGIFGKIENFETPDIVIVQVSDGVTLKINKGMIDEHRSFQS